LIILNKKKQQLILFSNENSFRMNYESMITQSTFYLLFWSNILRYASTYVLFVLEKRE